MNDIVLAIILGCIEGLTEFLPVSSTAHLRISQALLGISLEDEFWKMFAVVIQLGAILSVVVYFRERIRQLFFVPRGRLKTKIAASFIATAIPAFILSKLIQENLESMNVIGYSLLIGGVVMILVDMFYKREKTVQLDQLTFNQAVGIGVIQILAAVFPGVSRSMSTIVGGQLLGLSRVVALEFSFLISIPIMGAATGYDFLKFVRDGSAGMAEVQARWLTLLVGLVVSFVVALAVIAWFMAWVRKRSFIPFGVYRVAVGLFVLLYF